jgi:hypothetical protein
MRSSISSRRRGFIDMRLADFIREALGEIALGVHGAKSDVRDLVAIVPGTLNGDMLIEKSYVDFDNAVTATNDTSGKNASSGKAGAGISVVGIKLGADGSVSEESFEKTSKSLTSRIAFKVPLYLNAHFRGDSGAADEAKYVNSRWANFGSVGSLQTIGETGDAAEVTASPTPSPRT